MLRSRLPVASVWWLHAMHPTRCLCPGNVRILQAQPAGRRGSDEWPSRIPPALLPGS